MTLVDSKIDPPTQYTFKCHVCADQSSSTLFVGFVVTAKRRENLCQVLEERLRHWGANIASCILYSGTRSTTRGESYICTTNSSRKLHFFPRMHMMTGRGLCVFVRMIDWKSKKTDTLEGELNWLLVVDNIQLRRKCRRRHDTRYHTTWAGIQSSITLQQRQRCRNCDVWNHLFDKKKLSERNVLFDCGIRCVVVE